MALSIVDIDTNCFGQTCRLSGDSWGDGYFMMLSGQNARVAQVQAGPQTVEALGAGVTDVVDETIASGGNKWGGPSNVPGTDYAIMVYCTFRGISTGGSFYSRIISPFNGEGGIEVLQNSVDNIDYGFYAGGGRTFWDPVGSSPNMYVQALSSTVAIAVWNDQSYYPALNYGMYSVIDISDDIVTVNAPQYISNPDDATGYSTWFAPISMKRLSDSQVLIIYKNYDGDTHVWAAIGTISGTTLTLSGNTLIESGELNPASFDVESSDDCAAVHPFSGKTLQVIHNTAAFGVTYFFRAGSEYGPLTSKSNYEFPCAGAPMGEAEFLTAALDSGGTANPELQVVTMEEDDSITLGATTLTLAGGASVFITGIWIIEDGLAVAFGSSDAYLIGGPEILLAEEPPAGGGNRLWVYKTEDGGQNWTSRGVTT